LEEEGMAGGPIDAASRAARASLEAGSAPRASSSLLVISRQSRVEVPFLAGERASLRRDRIDPGELDPQALSKLPDETYDCLFADQVLQQVARPSVAIANWVRVVRPGGIVGLTVAVDNQARRQPANGWRFAVQDPDPGNGRLNLVELLQSLCHLVEIDGIRRRPAQPEGKARGHGPIVEVQLRKRLRALTPVQSNHSTEAQLLTKLARSAITARSLWQPLDEFESILASGVVEATVVDLGRLYLLYQWLLSTLRFPGHCIEIGCFRGGTAKLISEVLVRRRIAAKLHLFDTFAGMPDRLASDEAGLKGTFQDTSLGAVRRLLANNPRVQFHRGIFPDSIPSYLNRRRFRFAHIDVDIERSVWQALAFVYPRLATGGVIVIDDYGHSECPGATRAVERFFAGKPETIVQMPLVSSAVVVKVA
jgi:O-methyltransferase